MHRDPPPLSTEELQQLVHLLADGTNRAGHDLLAFIGAQSVAGIVTKMMIVEGPERRVLLIAIRRTLEQARDQV